MHAAHCKGVQCCAPWRCMCASGMACRRMLMTLMSTTRTKTPTPIFLLRHLLCGARVASCSLWCSSCMLLHSSALAALKCSFLVAALTCSFLVARLGLARIMHVARVSWFSSREEPREAPCRHLPRTHVPLHLPRLLSALHTARGMCAFAYLGTRTECYPTCTVLWQLKNASAVAAALAALPSCVPTIC